MRVFKRRDLAISVIYYRRVVFGEFSFQISGEILGFGEIPFELHEIIVVFAIYNFLIIIIKRFRFLY